MATIFLDRIDASPILSDVFEPPFATWLAVLVNVLNENIQDIQNAFNLLEPSVIRLPKLPPCLQQVTW